MHQQAVSEPANGQHWGSDVEGATFCRLRGRRKARLGEILLGFSLLPIHTLIAAATHSGVHLVGWTMLV